MASQSAAAFESLAPSRADGYLSVLSPTPSSSGSAAASLVTQAPSLHRRDAQSSTTSSSCTLNEVVVQINTQVLIPDYREYYSVPITQFQMHYRPLADGSLVAGPYLSEIQQGNWLLLFIGMLLMLFLRNSVVSVDYIRRVRVKRKGLFYALLISQLLGVVTFISLAASFLASTVNCRATMVFEGLLTEGSAAILLSGILGVKAYRCLNDSKFVLIFVGILQCSATALVLIDLVKLQAIRRLSRSCAATTDFKFLPMSITIRFVIALFICLCFMYALWKSSKLPAAQGRISLRLSAHEPPKSPVSENEKEEVASIGPRPRGWWDYVPETNPPMTEPQQSRASTWHIVDDGGFVQNMRFLMFSKKVTRSPSGRHKREKSNASQASQQQLTNVNSVHFQDNVEKSYFDVSRAASPAQSHTGSVGKLMDRMRHFREMLRNELAHTAFITLTNVIATILGLVGVFGDLPISPAFFIGADWAILSLLVMNSFDHVVERSEREALVQHPSAWDPLYHVEKATNGDVRRVLSSVSVASNPRRNRSTVDLDDEQDAVVIASDNRVTRDALPPPLPLPGFPPPPTPSQPSPLFRADNPFEDFEFVTGTEANAQDEKAHESSDDEPNSPDGEAGSTSSWRTRDRNVSPVSVPSSPSVETHESVLHVDWLNSGLPASHIPELYYRPDSQALSPVSRYSQADTLRRSLLFPPPPSTSSAKR